MPRAGLDPDAVLRLALGVVDDEGWAGLSLASVATRAGVAVPSLYKHVAGLPALRRAVAQVCVEDLTRALRTARGTRAGAEALQAMAHATRDFARRFPGRYLAVQGSWAQDPEAEDVRRAAKGAVDLMAEAVAELDVPAEQRIDAVRAVRSAVHGFVMLELDGGFGMPQDVDASFTFLVDRLVDSVRSEQSGRQARRPNQTI